MAKLSRSASGTKYLRWLREIVATMEAHLEYNYLLNEAQKQALAAEVQLISAALQTLEARVAAYQGFLGQAFIKIRAKQRVANYLCDEAQRVADGSLRPYRRDIAGILPGGYTVILSRAPMSRVLRAGHEKTAEFADTGAGILRSLPDKIPGTAFLADRLEQASSLLRGFIAEADAIEAQRQPLRMAVSRSIFEVRELLEQTDGRLRTPFSRDFIDSLYPELSRGGKSVLGDDEDEDDDTAEAQ